MISGDKKMAIALVEAAVFESLKDAFNLNHSWESSSCDKARALFALLSVTVAKTVLCNMSDTGDVTYVRGKPTKSDVENGVNQVAIGLSGYEASYRAKKVVAFKIAFKKHIIALAKQWKEGFDVHFNLSARRKAKGGKC